MPESLDPSTLRTIALVAVAVVVVLGFLVMRMVQKMVLKVVFLGALAGIGVYAWSQRAALDDCRTTCACSFAGVELESGSIPGCPDTTP